VETGENVMIGGFIITGNAPKKVILRAIGPSLAARGVEGVLADPVLALHGPGGSLIIENDNWKTTQQAQIEESGMGPQNDLESAIVATLQPGSYTAIVRGQGETSGVVCGQIYDLDPTADSHLANISTRALVQTGENVLIGGFILSGSDSTARMILRAIGPSLTSRNVSNALPDPTLDLRNRNGERVAFNDDWMDDPTQAAQIAAAGIPPSNERESAIAATLPPGAYTVIVTGKDESSGVGLVEIYNLQ